MLTAYFDDSGTHLAAEITLLAGLHGNQHQWALFENLWAEVLSTTIPNKAARRFHATDCHASRADFAGWSRHETDYLMHQLCRVILRCGLAGCGTSVARKAWDKFVMGDVRRATGDAERGCLQTVFLDTLYWAQRFAPHETEIAFVFDDRPERKREYEVIHSIFADNAKLVGEKPELVSLTFARAAKSPPLQGADLFAWEMYQEEVACLSNPLPYGKFHRPLIASLVKSGKFRIRNGDVAMIANNTPVVEKMIDAAALAEIDRRFSKP